MTNEYDNEKQAAPITLRRSSQKGHEPGWTLALPADATAEQIEEWIVKVVQADAFLCGLFDIPLPESVTAGLTADLEETIASLNGGKA